MKKEILEKVLNSKKNLIVSGDMSTGKTTNVLFPLVKEIITQNQSLLVLDPKEEYINEYYEDLKKKNYNIVMLNLKDLSKSEGWNPLEYPYNLYKEGQVDEAIDYIVKQVKVMFYENDDAESFWINSACDFYTGVVLGLFEDGKKDEINLNSINLMLSGMDTKYGASDYITEYFKLKNHDSQAYIYASATAFSPSATKGGIIATVRQKLISYVSKEKLNLLLNKTTFKYEDILSKPTAIFIIAKDENKCINNIATMFIEQLFEVLVNSQNHYKFNFVLDNIDVLEKIQELSNMLGAGISKDIKFEIATRSLDNLIEKYGNYILKLNDIVEAEKITDEIKRLSKSDKKINIEYPHLDKVEIKKFDLKSFVATKKSEIVASTPNPFNSNNETINKILKELDKKINELDKKDTINDTHN